MNAAAKRTLTAGQLGHEALEQLRKRYFIHEEDIDPRVFYRITDNWIGLTVRFITDAWNYRDTCIFPRSMRSSTVTS